MPLWLHGPVLIPASPCSLKDLTLPKYFHGVIIIKLFCSLSFCLNCLPHSFLPNVFFVAESLTSIGEEWRRANDQFPQNILIIHSSDKSVFNTYHTLFLRSVLGEIERDDQTQKHPLTVKALKQRDISVAVTQTHAELLSTVRWRIFIWWLQKV